MRFFLLALMSTGCAFISDKHEEWRLDPDGDGVDIRSDCDDNDGELGLPVEWYLDQDEDGFGADDDMKRQCTRPEGYVRDAGDCDDTNPAISPAAEEQCDLIDNDCDLEVDEGTNSLLAYTDGDGDGYGDASTEQLVCALSVDQVLNGDDCDDSNPFWQVQQETEVFYNGIDDNCDEADVDGDQDGDGYWASDYAEQVRDAGGEPMEVAPEAQGDCLDTDASTHPGALDAPYDGRDQDCKGEDDYDQDRDGHVPDEYVGLSTEGVSGSGSLPGGDCNDYVDSVRPGLVEDCSTPHDDDCDGSTMGIDVRGCIDFFQDYDGDGYGGTESRCQCEADFEYGINSSNDCNDFDANVYPGAFDTPYDGIDADCAKNDDFDRDKDGYVPDEYMGLVTDGVERTGTLPGGDCDDADGTVNPDGVETCLTDADDDCDGTNNGTDVEGCSVFHKDADDDGYGDPTLTICACAPFRAYRTTDSRDCDDDDGATYPGAPDAPYDALDKDCGGDDDFDHDGDGFAKRGHEGEVTLMGGRIVAGTGSLPATDCDDADPSIHPDADELCDGADNDCDDEVDESDALDAKSLYVDEDGDGFGDEDTLRRACVISGGVVEIAGDCDDDDPETYPGAEELCDGIDQSCDGDLVGPLKDSDADALPDCIDPPYIPDVAFAVLNGNPGARAGDALHIDDDGRLAIGAPMPMDGNAYVHLLAGVEEGVTALARSDALASPMRAPGWSDLGDATEMSWFGANITSLPAADGDGTDLVVTAHADSAVIAIGDPLSPRSIEWPSGVDELWALEAEPPGTTSGQCGTAVASGMFSLGADPSPGLVLTCAGLAYVFNQDTWSAGDRLLGSMGTPLVGLDTSGLTVVGDTGFGDSVTSGDFNGDGIDDVAIGSETGMCTAGACGSVYVFLGPHDFTASIVDADLVVDGETAEDRLGYTILSPGDLTGDGSDDLLVATDRGPLGGDGSTGAVLLFDSDALALGYGLESDARTVIHGDQLGSWFGAAMAAVPDLDGDGVPELVVGAPNADGPDSGDGDNHGAVYGLMSPWPAGSRALGLDDRVLHGSLPNAGLGLSVAAGDILLDGSVDIAVAEPSLSITYVLNAHDWLLD